MENFPFEWTLRADCLDVKNRFFIFIIIGASAGLPALVWSVGELINHRRNGHRISVFIILLLLTDFAELFLSPYTLLKLFFAKVISCENWVCMILSNLWWAVRECGLLLNQLVALEGILSVRYPLYTAAVFSSACCRIFYIFTFVSIITGRLLSYAVFHRVYHFFLTLLVFVVSVFTWMMSLGASCSGERHSRTSRRADQHIWVVSIFTLLVLNLPYTLISLLEYCELSLQPLSIFYTPWFLMSVRLMSDPLLCVLVCRQSLRLQSSQKPEETNAV